MSIFIKDLMLNLLLILFLLILFPAWLDRKKWSVGIKRWVLLAGCTISLILCLSFPIGIAEGIIFDLRWVPFIIGGLYGGLEVNLFLVFVLAGYRFIIGGLGFYPTVVATIITSVYLISIRNHFLHYSLISKLKTVFTASLIHIVSLFLAVLWLVPQSISIEYFIGLGIIQTLGVLIVTYYTEVLRENSSMRRQILKLEKVNVASQLAASISHEVRNPLAAGKGFLQLLQRPNTTEQERKRYIKIALDEMERAESIINEYLAFSKPTTDWMKNIESLHLPTRFNEIRDILEPLAQSNNVIINIEMDDVHITGEEGKLKQCFINIMKNGIESMPDGGTLHVKGTKKGDYVTIEVSDTGFGMTHEQLERIGEPYYSTKGKAGTGLGLMVSYRIIETMKGKIDVSSELKKGTTFSISFLHASD